MNKNYRKRINLEIEDFKKIADFKMSMIFNVLEQINQSLNLMDTKLLQMKKEIVEIEDHLWSKKHNKKRFIDDSEAVDPIGVVLAAKTMMRDEKSKKGYKGWVAGRG